MNDEKITPEASLPSSVSSAGSASRDAPAWFSANTRAMLGIERELSDIRTAFATYERMARFREQGQQKSLDLNTSAMSDLIARIDRALQSITLTAGVSAAERESLAAARDKLDNATRSVEASRRFLTLPREESQELTAGRAPKFLHTLTDAGWRYVSATGFFASSMAWLAHVLWGWL